MNNQREIFVKYQREGNGEKETEKDGKKGEMEEGREGEGGGGGGGEMVETDGTITQCQTDGPLFGDGRCAPCLCTTIVAFLNGGICSRLSNWQESPENLSSFDGSWPMEMWEFQNGFQELLQESSEIPQNPACASHKWEAGGILKNPSRLETSIEANFNQIWMEVISNPNAARFERQLKCIGCDQSAIQFFDAFEVVEECVRLIQASGANSIKLIRESNRLGYLISSVVWNDDRGWGRDVGTGTALERHQNRTGWLNPPSVN